MSDMTPLQFEMLLYEACVWARQQECAILKAGVPLTDPQDAGAKRIGVIEPKRVRLLRVPSIPGPTHPLLAELAKKIISSSTEGLTLRYGIFIRHDCWDHQRLVVHELVHTMQYERTGGFGGFLRPYLTECIVPPGYPFGPLEQEAVRVAHEMCPTV